MPSAQTTAGFNAMASSRSSEKPACARAASISRPLAAAVSSLAPGRRGWWATAIRPPLRSRRRRSFWRANGSRPEDHRVDGEDLVQRLIEGRQVLDGTKPQVHHSALKPLGMNWSHSSASTRTPGSPSRRSVGCSPPRARAVEAGVIQPSARSRSSTLASRTRSEQRTSSTTLSNARTAISSPAPVSARHCRLNSNALVTSTGSQTLKGRQPASRFCSAGFT